MNRAELMSPAGSFESFQAAIQAGADSVYFGVEQLNMRAKSGNNFTIDDLATIQKRAAATNTRTYLTLNTILYDHDIALMKRVIDAAKENRINAVIASDHAALSYAKRAGMPIHLSTQANVSNLASVIFYADYADTIVLARELTLLQVADIVKQIRRQKIKGPSGELVKIEVFAHGALCMAVSGKCYMSLHTNYASANRGACVQNCRRSYIVKEKNEEAEFEIDNEYIMSSKDLCTIGFLDKLLEAGVDVLKIEGRGRPADYVHTTTKCYREAIDAYYAGNYDAAAIGKWTESLATVFNRGFWEGYYLGKETGEWANEYGSKATRKKIYIGKGLKYFDRQKTAEFKLESNNLLKGNTILVTGPSTGVVSTTVSELRVNETAVNEVKKGETFSIPLDVKIRPSDKLYKIVEMNDKDHAAAE